MAFKNFRVFLPCLLYLLCFLCLLLPVTQAVYRGTVSCSLLPTIYVLFPLPHGCSFFLSLTSFKKTQKLHSAVIYPGSADDRCQKFTFFWLVALGLQGLFPIASMYYFFSHT